MARSGRDLDRLISLAGTLGVYTGYPGLHLSRPSAPVATESDTENVKLALERTRSVRFEAKKHVFRKKPSAKPASSEEATATLQSLISNGCTSAQARQLVEAGANVNFSREKSKGLVDKVRSKDQENVRSNVFRLAVQSGDVHLVDALATHADQENRNSALGLAIDRADLEMVKLLIVMGADPNPVEVQLQNAIRNQNNNLSQILLSGSSHLSPDRATRCLVDAVTHGDLCTVQLLLWQNADPNTQNGAALSIAAQSERSDLVVALCLAKTVPLPSHLARAVATLHAAVPGVFSPSNIKIVEILLVAGATGPDILQVIEDATNMQQRDLVRLLVSHSIFDPEKSPHAVRIAVRQGDLRLFEYLLSMGADAATVESLLTLVLSVRSKVASSVRYEMVKSLLALQPSLPSLGAAVLDSARQNEFEITQVILEAGAKGIEIDEALWCAVQDLCRGQAGYLGIVQLLVEHGADVNVRNGDCLTTAVSLLSDDALQALLQGLPSLATLNAAFCCCLKLHDVGQRYMMMSRIIDAGACGSAVNCALLDVLSPSSDDRRFRELFLGRAKADINFNNGRCIVKAATNGKPEILADLLRYGPTQDTLDTGLRHALSIAERGKRLEICRLLCQVQPKPTQETLSSCAVVIIREQHRDNELLQTMLQAGASNDYDRGAIIRTAIDLQDDAALSQLLKFGATSSTLIEAVEQVLKADITTKPSFCQMLLSAMIDPDVVALGKLLDRTFDTSEDVTLLQLFLEHRASVNTESIPAISKAIGLGNLNALDCLMGADASMLTIRKCWEHTWKSDGTTLKLLKILGRGKARQAGIDMSEYLVKAVHQSPSSVELIRFLLRQGANPSYDSNRSVKDAALRMDLVVLDTLLQRSEPKADLSTVLAATMSAKSPNVWECERGAEVVSLLLRNGVSNRTLSPHLLLCVQRYRTHKNARQLLDLLLMHQASPDDLNGTAFETAIRSADFELAEKLMPSIKERQTVNNAFPYTFESFRKEEVVINMVHKFTAHFDGMLDWNHRHKHLQPVVFEALRHFPRSKLLLDLLIEKGMPLTQMTVVKLSSDQPEEVVGVLLWALTNTSLGITDDVIMTLIRNSAEINSTGAVTNTTPLLMAAKLRRAAVVRALLEQGADPAIRDSFGRSPLCYACVNGEMTIVRTLVEEFQAPRNDYSLHEAILAHKKEIVRYLLSSGHDPNLVSSIHDMRNPIELLIRKRPPNYFVSELIELFELLANAGANFMYQSEGKSLLITALDMPHAIDMTTALLSACMGRHINDAFNIYCSNGFIYSPIAYISQNQQLSDPAFRATLLRILLSYGCKNVFYHEVGPQPPGYTGAPEELVQAENVHRARRAKIAVEEEDRQRASRWQTEDHYRSLQLKQESHAEALRQQKEIEDNKRQQSALTHHQILNQDRERSRLQLEHRRDEELQATGFAERRQNTELEYEQRQRTFRLEGTLHANSLQIEHQRDVAKIEQGLINSRQQADVQSHEMARKARAEQEEFEQRSHDRALSQVAARKSAQVAVMDQQKRLLEYQNKVNKTQQKALQWDDIDP